MLTTAILPPHANTYTTECHFDALCIPIKPKQKHLFVSLHFERIPFAVQIVHFSLFLLSFFFLASGLSNWRKHTTDGNGRKSFFFLVCRRCVFADCFCYCLWHSCPCLALLLLTFVVLSDGTDIMQCLRIQNYLFRLNQNCTLRTSKALLAEDIYVQ